ncbi:MAG: 1-aminocyclopropane-1-carboxylate deaminase/D-cysteine desulfhydrase [Cyclobacteriaceae bacterium]
MVLGYCEPSVQVFKHPVFDAAGIDVSVLREDLNHDFVSGNKWWKLRDNLVAATESGLPLLTFGGAYSNHIYATAAACHELNISCIGIIRGEDGQIESPTLRFAREKGMRIIRVSRENYRRKSEHEFLETLRKKIGEFYIVPEGGSNQRAVAACSDWGRKIEAVYGHAFDAIALPVGTGGTMAGIISGLSPRLTVHGFAVLKEGNFLKDQISGFIDNSTKESFDNWVVHTNYHFGGYGKPNEAVFSFIRDQHPYLPLDAVYTAKMMLGLIDLAKNGLFESGHRLLALHTGGLQGNSGFMGRGLFESLRDPS